MMITEYALNLNEKKKMQKWLKIHKEKCTKKNSSISLCFTPTGIGVGVDVVCSCGRKKEITDYGSW